MKNLKTLLVKILFLFFMVAYLMPSVVYSQALNFDGTDDYVRIQNEIKDLPQSDAPRTIEAWIKTKQANLGNIVSWGADSYKGRNSIAVRNGKLAFVGSYLDFTGSTPINDGFWRHIAITFDKSNGWKFYVDGKKENVTKEDYAGNSNKPAGYMDYNTQTPPDTDGKTLCIGKNLGNGEFFEGTIDEVKIWTRAKSAEEIKKDRYIWTKERKSGLLVYYTFGQRFIKKDLPKLPQASAARTMAARIKTEQTDIGNIVSWGSKITHQRNSMAVREGKLAFIGQYLDITGSIPVNNGSWHDVAITFDKDNGWKLYVDGKLDDKAKFEDSSGKNKKPEDKNTQGKELIIGKGLDEIATEVFKGAIENIRIWNTAKEVKDDGSIPLSGNDSDLIYQLDFYNWLNPGNNNSDAKKISDHFGANVGELKNFKFSGLQSNFINDDADDFLSSGASSVDELKKAYSDFNGLPETALRTVFDVMQKVEEGKYTEAQTELENIWKKYQKGDAVWQKAIPQSVGPAAGSPNGYVALRMLDDIVTYLSKKGSNEPEDVYTLNLSVVIINKAKGKMPVNEEQLLTETGEEIEVTIMPRIKDDDYKAVRQSFALFNQYINAITKGKVKVKLNIVEFEGEVSLRSYVNDKKKKLITTDLNSLSLIDGLPSLEKAETDWYAFIYPEIRPEIPGYRVNLSGGINTIDIGAVLKVDDYHILVKKPENVAFTEVEIRAGAPQFYQHEFFHFFYNLFPELHLEDQLHYWTKRNKKLNLFPWPSDFDGSYEVDYYQESLHKRMLDIENICKKCSKEKWDNFNYNCSCDFALTPFHERIKFKKGHFQGKNDFVSIQKGLSNLPQGNTPRTMETWIKTTQTNIGNIVSWGSNSNWKRNSMAVREGKLAFIGSYLDFDGSTVINDGFWHHVAITFDTDNGWKLYVDGNPETVTARDYHSQDNTKPSYNTLTAPNTDGKTLYIGKNLREGNLSQMELFKGEIRDVRIWDKVITIPVIDKDTPVPSPPLNGDEPNLVYNALNFYPVAPSVGNFTGLPQGSASRTIQAHIRTRQADSTWNNTKAIIGNVVSWGAQKEHQRNSLAVRGGKLAFIGRFLDITGSIPINDGQWHDVAITFEAKNKEWKLYVDGKLDDKASVEDNTKYKKAAVTLQTKPNTQGTKLIVGAGLDQKAERFSGEIKEIKIWSIAKNFGSNRVDSPAENLIFHYLDYSLHGAYRSKMISE